MTSPAVPSIPASLPDRQKAEVDTDRTTAGEPPQTADEAADKDRAAALLVAGLVLLHCVAYLPGLVGTSINARRPLAYAAAGFGLVLLARLAWRRDRAAIVLVAFLASSLLSGLLSSAPYVAVLPGPVDTTGWTFLVVYAGWWAIGRSLPRTARRYAVVGILVGALANVALSIVQIQQGGGSGLLDFRHDRAMGFLGNPVYLGSFLAGALVLSAALVGRTGRRWPWLLPFVGVLAAGVNLSGSRVALVAGAVLSIAALLVSAPRSLVRTLCVAGAIACGLASSWNALPQGGGGRVGESGGYTARIEVWKAGGDALLERPVLGWGPNRFGTGTVPKTTLELARAADPTTLHTDAHNVIVEVAVTTGLVGLGLFSAFVWLAARGARGPLAWFALASALSWLLQPVTIGPAPLVMLALGLAVARRDEPDSATGTRGGRSWIIVGAVSACLGLAASIPHLQTARDVKYPEGPLWDIDALDRAVGRFPHDPRIAGYLAAGLVHRATVDRTEAHVDEAMAAADRFVALDEAYGPAWGARATARRILFRDDPTQLPAIEADLLEAHRLMPWHPTILIDLHGLAIEQGDEVEAERWADKLCQIDLCPTGEPTQPTPQNPNDN